MKKISFILLVIVCLLGTNSFYSNNNLAWAKTPEKISPEAKAVLKAAQQPKPPKEKKLAKKAIVEPPKAVLPTRVQPKSATVRHKEEQEKRAAREEIRKKQAVEAVEARRLSSNIRKAQDKEIKEQEALERKLQATGQNKQSKRRVGVEEVQKFEERGYSTIYPESFGGKIVANGTAYNARQFTMAHRSYPLGSKIEVTNLENNKKTHAIVTDRGPYIPQRIAEVSSAVALTIGLNRHDLTRIGLNLVSGYGGSIPPLNTVAMAKRSPPTVPEKQHLTPSAIAKSTPNLAIDPPAKAKSKAKGKKKYTAKQRKALLRKKAALKKRKAALKKKKAALKKKKGRKSSAKGKKSSARGKKSSAKGKKRSTKGKKSSARGKRGDTEPVIQVTATKNRRTANAMRTRLIKSGFRTAKVSPTKVKGQIIYKVILPVKNTTQAKRTLTVLKKKKFTTARITRQTRTTKKTVTTRVIANPRMGS